MSLRAQTFMMTQAVRVIATACILNSLGSTKVLHIRRYPSDSELLKKSNLYLFGRLKNPVEPVLLDHDRVAVWPLPYFQADAVRVLWPEHSEEINTQTQAMAVVLDSIRERMRNYKVNILVSHSTVSDAELSDSDRSVRIGGASAVPA